MVLAILLIAAILPLTGGPDPRLAYAMQVEPTQQNVTYCTIDNVALKMDVYPPARRDAEAAPVVIYIHGGSWVSGDKSEVGLGAAGLNALGYLVVSLNYRLAPQYRWPAQINDVKCAVRYLKANASRYKVDPNRMGVWGASAGGHLASLIGLTDASAGFDNAGGYQDQTSKVQAVIDMFGPTDLPAYEPGGEVKGLGEAVFGYTLGSGSDVLVKASPVHYVSKAAPPFLILQGDKDTLVPLSQSQELHDRLRAAGADSTLVVVKNAGHAFVPSTGNLNDLDPSIDQIKAMVPAFFDKYLRNGGTATQRFAETGQSVGGKFLQYWRNTGALAQFGYPISGERLERSDTDGKTYMVQYFERAVFEMHPENQPPHDVLLSLLGSMRYRTRYPTGAPGQQPNVSAGSVAFSETGKRVGGIFLNYWRAHGGLTQYGLPLTDEFTEVSDLNGKPYRVQYFERAVFEFHPELAAPNNVLLTQLGTYRYRAVHPAGQATRSKP